MYSVSSAFIDAMKNPAQEHRLTGTIGSAQFDESNIIEGSFKISNQSTDSNDIVLGCCYIGELNAVITGINIPWGKWINKSIVPVFSLKTGTNTWEDVPLGIFKIKEANHTAEGIQITAYDNMIKFDKKFKKSHFMNLSGMYDIVAQICSDCGVTLGMTRMQIYNLPNGHRSGINIYGSTGSKKDFANDIDTYRDLLYWCAQTLGCFATINRLGELEFRQYTQNVVDEITDRERLSGATFADYVTHYVGIYVENLDSNTEDYYGSDATALQAEITETENEIYSDSLRIAQLDADLIEWKRKLNNHECTQEEYDAAVAEIDAELTPLKKEVKQLSKRLLWLEDALEQAGDDGSDMVLGANPITMAKNITTRDNQRREILGALSGISYTPFSASVVYGCIYDLGDVIQFSGGLYNSATDTFGCVMSYEYTHNGSTEMAGFGVDPSVVVVRPKTQKSTDRANKNAINAKEVSSGTENPSGGKEDDIYIKYKTKRTYQPKYQIEYYGWADDTDTTYQGQTLTFTKPDDMAGVVGEFVYWNEETGYYNFEIQGFVYSLIRSDQVPNVSANGFYCNPVFLLRISDAGKYKIRAKVSWRCEDLNPRVAPSFSELTTYNYIGVPPASFLPFSGGEEETEYEAVYTVSESEVGDPLYFWIEYWFPYISSSMQYKAAFYLDMKDLRVEKIIDESGHTDSGVDETKEKYIEDIYVKETDEDTGVESWRKIDFVAGADTSSWSGLSLDYKRMLSLQNYVMRAWYKADPPQIGRDFAQFCVRYTGAPDTAIQIKYHGASGWSNTSVKKTSDHVYTIKCGGTCTSGNIEYVAYKLSNLVVGQRYFFNFAANFGDGASFGHDNSKGLGVVFNTTGVIDTDNYSGDPHTFHNDTLYESFYRSTKKRYYDFDFRATAETMYMCVVVADIADGVTTSLKLNEFVVSRMERDYIRKMYLYDYTTATWLEYRPFGSGDDGTTPSALEDLSDIELIDLQDGQILVYDAQTGTWINADNESGVGRYADLPDKPSVNGVTLSGNKTSADLGMVITLSQPQYDALSQADKNDPNKVYYIYDAGGGGGGGSSTLAGLTDVGLDNIANGQILKYNSTTQKWENANESGGGGGSDSEIITITAGTGTTSRTFEFTKTPKKITVSYYSADSTPWFGHWDFIWGDAYVYGYCAATGNAGQIGLTGVRAKITYGSDGKSFEITGGNAFQAWNLANGNQGQMFVEY